MTDKKTESSFPNYESQEIQDTQIFLLDDIPNKYVSRAREGAAGYNPTVRLHNELALANALWLADYDIPIIPAWGPDSKSGCGCKYKDAKTAKQFGEEFSHCQSPGKHPKRSGWQAQRATSPVSIQKMFLTSKVVRTSPSQLAVMKALSFSTLTVKRAKHRSPTCRKSMANCPRLSRYKLVLVASIITSDRLTKYPTKHRACSVRRSMCVAMADWPLPLGVSTLVEITMYLKRASLPQKYPSQIYLSGLQSFSEQRSQEQPKANFQITQTFPTKIIPFKSRTVVQYVAGRNWRRQERQRV